MWDRFDICEAYWRFAVDFHGGQSCPIFRYFARLRRLDFHPRQSLVEPVGHSIPKGRRALSENGQDIYDGLIRKWMNCYSGGPLKVIYERTTNATDR